MTEQTLREMDAEVAEKVMGWQRLPDYNYWMTFPESESFKLHKLIANWKPSTDISAAMEVEERIAKLNLEREYISALIPIVSRAASEQGKVFNYFFVAHASPEQRCLAALAAVERQ